MVFQGRSVFPCDRSRQCRLRSAGQGLCTGRPPDEGRDDSLERVGWLASPRLSPPTLGRNAAAGSDCRALAVDPDLSMDEPSPPSTSKRARPQEELLFRSGSTPADRPLHTHSIDEAMLLGDRIVVFGSQPGRIEDDSASPSPGPRTLAGVRSHPASGCSTESGPSSRARRGRHTSGLLAAHQR
jgi:NitT/TauT family transport system ATP-binding protein